MVIGNRALGDDPFFIRTPPHPPLSPKDHWIPSPQIFVGAFEKVFLSVLILSASLKKKPAPPPPQLKIPAILRGVRKKCGTSLGIWAYGTHCNDLLG